MINERPEYDLPPAVKLAPKTALLRLIVQSTGMRCFGYRSYTTPYGLSEFAIVSLACPISIT
jgi:hypothetical protein